MQRIAAPRKASCAQAAPISAVSNPRRCGQDQCAFCTGPSGYPPHTHNSSWGGTLPAWRLGLAAVTKSTRRTRTMAPHAAAQAPALKRRTRSDFDERKRPDSRCYAGSRSGRCRHHMVASARGSLGVCNQRAASEYELVPCSCTDFIDCLAAVSRGGSGRRRRKLLGLAKR